MIARRIQVALLIGLLPGCAIENQVPGFTFPVTSAAANAPWPDLVDQRQFAAAFDAARPADSVETLEERVASLKARAEAARAPVLTNVERRRLERAR